jgi:predicted nucleic acid-binding Zn ribbon protein
MQRITEPALKRCPTCKSKVERIISATSFVLKGSGWYATDYARSASSKSADVSGNKPAESGDNGANGSSGSSPSESSSSSDKSSSPASSEKGAKVKASD